LSIRAECEPAKRIRKVHNSASVASLAKREIRMKIATSIVGTTVLVLLVSAAARPVAQPMGFQAELLKDFATNRETMLKIADAMPDEKFSFKATPAERSYGEQILHVAVGNVTLFKMIGSKAPAPTIDQKRLRRQWRVETNSRP
jgi:hypothetical protein